MEPFNPIESDTQSISVSSTSSFTVIRKNADQKMTFYIVNTGSVAATIKRGPAGTSAADTDMLIPAGAPPMVMRLGDGNTGLAAKTASGSTTLVVTPGSGSLL